MAKINILFNGTEYAIDEANLAPATDALKAHFETLGNEGDLPITLDGAVYKVDSAKLAPATNSFIAHLETLKGGGLAEGGTYTLKTNLHDIDPNNFMKTPETDASTEGMYRVAKFNAKCVLSYLDANAMAAVSGGTNDINTDGWSFVDMNNSFKSYIWARKYMADTDNTVADNDFGWFDMSTKQPVTEPITVTISDFDESYGGYSLEELAVFFDIPTSGNDGDTKIVINGVDYFVDSAKLADAKSALAAHLKALENASNEGYTVEYIGDNTGDADHELYFNHFDGSQTTLVGSDLMNSQTLENVISVEAYNFDCGSYYLKYYDDDTVEAYDGDVHSITQNSSVTYTDADPFTLTVSAN